MRLRQDNGLEIQRSRTYRPTTLLVGDWDHNEMAEPVAMLRRRTDLLAVTDIEQAVRIVAPDDAAGRDAIQPELVVLAQARPGRFSEDDVARLKRCVPLARVLALLGSWCEGETRTGTPWPAADRCFWYQWPARFETELDRVGRGVCPAWGLPETASLDERALWTAEQSEPEGRPQRHGTVLVAARSMATSEAVGDACRDAGWAAESIPQRGVGREARLGGRRHVAPLVAAVWEGTQCESGEENQLAEFCAWLEPAPVVVLLDFPRHHGCARAISAGAAGVVAKPFQLDDLVWQLRKAMTQGDGLD